MKLSDITFSYKPQSAETLDKPFRVLGAPLVRIIDRRLSHTAVGKAEDGEEGETTYYYYVLVCGSDSFGEDANLEWYPEDRVWGDIKDFYVPHLHEGG